MLVLCKADISFVVGTSLALFLNSMLQCLCNSKNLLGLFVHVKCLQCRHEGRRRTLHHKRSVIQQGGKTVVAEIANFNYPCAKMHPAVRQLSNFGKTFLGYSALLCCVEIYLSLFTIALVKGLAYWWAEVYCCLFVMCSVLTLGRALLYN